MHSGNKDTKLYVVGLSFEKANQQIRNKYSLSNEKLTAFLEEAKQNNIQSAVVLSTCNRTEIFGFVPHPYMIIELMCKHSDGSVDDLMQYAYTYKGNEAVSHMFEVAAGIKSQILGDYEIISQIKNAAKTSQEYGLLDPYMGRLLDFVIQSSRDIKNQTTISGGTTSTSYASISYLKSKFDNLRHRKITVLGVGDIGKSTLKNLLEYTDCEHIKLINRTQSKAERFAETSDRITSGKFDHLKEELVGQDVLFVCSSANKILVETHHLPDHQLTIIDLSLPNNVDLSVKNESQVQLVLLDDLSSVTDSTIELRKQEIPKAQEIIDSYKTEYNNWLSHRQYTPVIHGLRETLKSIQEVEVKVATKHKPELADIANEVSDKVIQKITNRFAHYLKNDPEMANQSVAVIKEVFNIKT